MFIHARHMHPAGKWRTTLVFQQSVPPEMDPADVGCGWHWYLDRLEAALVGAAMPSWPDYFPALVSAYRDGQSP